MAFGLIIIFDAIIFSTNNHCEYTDDKDAPLPNVKVVEKGTNNGVLTDFDEIIQLQQITLKSLH